MLFDESEIEEAHASVLKIEPAKALLGHLSIAIDLVRNSYIQNAHAPIIQTVIFSLAVRAINSAGACLKLAGSGYFAGAFHQLRELAELGELLEYFIAKPEKIIEWSEATGWDRVDKFSFRKMDKGLRGNFNIATRWAERFEQYSELGTHVGAAGAYAIAKDDEFQYGPHIDQVKFIQILGELTVDTLAIADAYVRLFDSHYDQPIHAVLPKEYALLRFSLEHAKDAYERLFVESSRP